MSDSGINRSLCHSLHMCESCHELPAPDMRSLNAAGGPICGAPGRYATRITDMRRIPPGMRHELPVCDTNYYELAICVMNCLLVIPSVFGLSTVNC